MLSRVAERIYWLGRYLERVENTARLINVYGNVLLDLPRPAKLVWESLIAINGDAQTFAARYSNADERSVVRFYLADRNNPNSLRSSLSAARENARTVREIVPANGWEAINDLSIYLDDRVDQALARRGREEFLNHVISACQFVAGTIDGTMSRDSAYSFLVIGRLLERADMTSRIVDVGLANVFPWVSWMLGDDKPLADGEVTPYESALWMSVLRSLSALQMYRRLVPERVRAEEVVGFLLQDTAFPRALAHCLTQLSRAVEELPGNERVHARVAAISRRVREANVNEILNKRGLFDFIDDVQVEFGALHTEIQSNWFLPVEETA